jgi:AraC-like DNA-binding protein
MDYHIFDEVTIEMVKQAHMVDKKTQDKYNVKYHQFWVNEKAGTVFCLIEGPNANACEQVHREAHGNVACNIVEVKKGMLDAFMGKAHSVEGGAVYNGNGSIDFGHRYILVLDIIARTSQSDNLDLLKFQLPEKPRQAALNLISQHKGNEVKNLSDDSILAVFEDANNVLNCALDIQEQFLQEIHASNWDIEFRIGLNDGQPITMADGFFEDAMNYAKHLSLIARDKEIVISNTLKKLSDPRRTQYGKDNWKVVDSRQHEFIERLFKCTDSNLSNDNFTINKLSKDINMSRPQLSRKITSITGRSPVNFIRDLKMHRALFLIKDKNLNISEVALEVGYNNPSYFSKCFQERFGIMPSKM